MISVAVMVWVPLVAKVMANVPEPPLTEPGAGNVAAESLLLNTTVPE